METARGFLVSKMIHYARSLHARPWATYLNARTADRYVAQLSTGSLSRLNVSRIGHVACPLHCSCGRHIQGIDLGTQSAADCCYWCY